MARKLVRGALVTLSLLLLVGCDHGTKLLAKSALEPGARRFSIIPGVLDLRYTENRDTAFSLLRRLHLTLSAGALSALAIATVVFLAALWFARRHAPRHEHVAYALLIGGALGNIIDRVVRGYVVDFIHLRYWPVFNVADVAIVAGALLLLVVRLREHEPASARALWRPMRPRRSRPLAVYGRRMQRGPSPRRSSSAQTGRAGRADRDPP